MLQYTQGGEDMKTRKIILVIVSLLVVAFIVATVGFASYISHYNLGVVTQISIKNKTDSTVELQMKYLFASGGYSVRNVSENEGEYTGDGIKEYDGALGKYRILIEFGDVALTDSFDNKMDENGIIQLTKDMCARVTHPSGHGFALYVGCDKPISVETKKGIKLNFFGGTIKIPIAIEN